MSIGRIANFLSLYPKEHTQKIYRSGIFMFLDVVIPPEKEDKKSHRKGYFVTPEEMQKYEKLANQYFSQQRDYYQDVTNFLNSLNGRPNLTIHTYLYGVRGFLKRNGVIPKYLDYDDFKEIKKRFIKTTEAISEEEPLSTKDLKNIIMNMTTPLGRALFSFMASAGTRIGETLQLEFQDVNFTNKKIEIKGKITKTGKKRYTYFSEEAKTFLQQWLELRPHYRKRGKASQIWNPEQDKRIFPICQTTARRMWIKALERLGLSKDIDPDTRRLKRKMHQTRKFFRTKLGAAIGSDIAEALMGHGEYQTRVYRQYKEEELKKYYEQGEESLSLFGVVDVKELHDEVEGYKRTISIQAKEIMELRGELREVKEDLKRILKVLPGLKEE